MTVQNVVDALHTHFLPLFDPECSIAAVVTGPSKAGDISQGLESVGFEVERREISGDAWLDDTGSSDGGSDTSGGSKQ